MGVKVEGVRSSVYSKVENRTLLLCIILLVSLKSVMMTVISLTSTTASFTFIVVSDCSMHSEVVRMVMYGGLCEIDRERHQHTTYPGPPVHDGDLFHHHLTSCYLRLTTRYKKGIEIFFNIY